jgi:hypothetical protein
MADEAGPESSPLRAAVILVLIAAMVGGTWFIMRELRRSAALQDCVASGRRDCAPIGPGR